MTRTVSETSLVSAITPIQLEHSQIVLHDEDENSNVLDIDEYCPNREVVNLENAAVNIDNCTDVIIGPVNQWNVNGNITIYSNGNAVNEVVNGTAINQEPVNQEQQPGNTFTDGAKLGKCEKSESEEQDLHNINRHKKTVRILVSISFALLVTIGVIVLILHYTNNVFNDNSSDYTPTEPGGNKTDNLGNHQVLDRAEWGGRPPRRYEDMSSPVPMVIIKHTGGGPCASFQTCAGKAQSIQSNDVSKGLPDIRYSFLIGGDGNIYVGRGWDVQPDQISDTIDIVFIGSYAFDVLTDSMIEAAQLLLQYGVDQDKLTKEYKLVAHNQTANTESPGTNVYKEILTWEHFDGQLKIDQENWRDSLAWTDTSVKHKTTPCNNYVKIAGAILIFTLSAIVVYVILYNVDKEVDESDKGDDDEGGDADYIGGHRLYYRRDWGGNPPTGDISSLTLPTNMVVLSHSATSTCSSFQACSSQVRSFQTTHVNTHGFFDIGYNFVIGDDGNIYVGRGWNKRNFHTHLECISVGLIGSFDRVEMSSVMISTLSAFIEFGVTESKFTTNYILIGQNQTDRTLPLSPGENVFRVIRDWPHFSDQTFFP